MDQNEFKTHPIWDSLKNIRVMLQDIALKPEADTPAVQVHGLVALVGYLEGDLQRAIPEFTPRNVWNTIASHLSQTQGNLQQYSSIPNAAYTESALLGLEAALTLSASLPRHATTELQSMTESFGASIQTYAVQLKKLRSDTEGTAGSLPVVDQQVTDLSATIVAQKSRLDTAISEFQSQFSTEQSKRSEAFSTEREKVVELQSRLEKEAAIFTEKFEQDHTAALSSTTKYLEQRKAEIDKLCEAAGTTAISNDYQKATKDASARRLWFELGAVAILCLAIVIVLILGLASGAELNWPKLTARLSAVGVCIFGVQFLARLASFHRASENDARQKFLKLALLNTYIVSLSDEQQKKVREELVPQFFGKETLAIDVEPTATKALTDGIPAIKAITDLLTAARK